MCQMASIIPIHQHIIMVIDTIESEGSNEENT